MILSRSLPQLCSQLAFRQQRTFSISRAAMANLSLDSTAKLLSGYSIPMLGYGKWTICYASISLKLINSIIWYL